MPEALGGLAVVDFAELKEHYERRKQQQAARTGPLAQGAAYVAGEIMPLSEARVPLFDHGFSRSDLTYDVPAVWGGRYFRLADHIERLEGACAKLRLKMPMSGAELSEMLIELVQRSGIQDAFVEVIASRGLMPPGERDPRKSIPALYAYVIPYVWVLPLEKHEDGGSAVVARTVRRTPPGAFDPTVKNLQWGDLTRGIFEAGDRGADVAFLSDGDGNITEGPGFNIFALVDGIIHTPRRGVLEGVTRRTVLEIAGSMGHSVSVHELPVGHLYSAAEIFITSTAGGVMPITTLDGAKVGTGVVGPVTRSIWERYWDLHSDEVLSTPVDYGRFDDKALSAA